MDADVLPDDKHWNVEKLKAGGKVVAMAEDSVNDAPTLAEAEVGIAMDTGTEVAIRSAEVPLVRGNLGGHRRREGPEPDGHAQHLVELDVRLCAFPREGDDPCSEAS